MNINVANLYGSYQQSYAESIKSDNSHIKPEHGEMRPGNPAAIYERTTEKDMHKLDAGAAVYEHQEPKLSARAQKLLKELQEKYGDTSFIVASYSSDDEADRLLARGSKEYSVLISPETLEEMAADDKVKQKYIDEIDGARSQFDQIKERLISSGGNLTANQVKISFDQDGKAQIVLALLEKSTGRKAEVSGSAMDDLWEKIGGIDWESIPVDYDKLKNSEEMS